jgi:hypothetical protein
MEVILAKNLPHCASVRDENGVLWLATQTRLRAGCGLV